MKNFHYLLLICFSLLAACSASKKLANSVVGTWNYTISDTPYGDVAGVMNIAKAGDGYAGTLTTDEGTLELKNVKISDSKLTCTFTAQGYDLDMDGTFEGDSFKGEVGVDFNTFDMTATKVQK